LCFSFFFSILVVSMATAAILEKSTLKGTNIENGIRYVQILNCAPILPVRTNFGRFEIRMYADNNTRCIWPHSPQCLHKISYLQYLAMCPCLLQL
jgi:hypothetical protein